MRRFARDWLPALLWMALIFVISGDAGSAEHTSRILGPLLRWLKPDLTAEQLALAHFVLRKGGHLTGYAVLAVLLWRGFRATLAAHTAWSWRAAGWAWLGAALYALSDEVHQSFVRSRTASAGDVLIDAAGAALGLAVVRMVMAWRGK